MLGIPKILPAALDWDVVRRSPSAALNLHITSPPLPGTDHSKRIGRIQRGRIHSTAPAKLTPEVYYRFAREDEGDSRKPPKSR